MTLLTGFGAVASSGPKGGQRVLPKTALAAGFVFRHPTLAGTLDGLLGRADVARVDERPRVRNRRHHRQIVKMLD